MLEKLDRIKQETLAALAKVEDEGGLDQWRLLHLGRSSAIMDVFKNMGSIPQSDRGMVGRTANQVKGAMEAALTEKTEAMRQAALE
ncbi:MAG: phenylalanine--tRNA ligase subunit alpha, partial [Anaerolineales bacterium]|nr:phenylalanine--tRNA ligase subunit alpha [Anaerolineales bacterium]